MSSSGSSRRESQDVELLTLTDPSPKLSKKTPSFREQKEEQAAMDPMEFLKQHQVDCSSSKFKDAHERFYASIPTTFAKYDTDGSGKLDAKEAGVVLREMGYDLSPDQMKELLLQVDVDRDGSLDVTEFTVLLELWLHAAQFKVLDSATEKTDEHIDSSIFGRVNALVPDVPWRWFWELSVLLSLTYFWCATMCAHVFELSNRVLFFQVSFFPDFGCTMILLAEMAMKMNMAVINKDGKLLDTKKAILSEYFKFWFWVDFLAMFPFRWITGNPFPAVASDLAFVVNHLRLFGVIRMPYMFKSSGLIKVSLNYIGFHFTFMPYLWLVIFFLCSLTFCMAVNVQFFRDEIEIGLRDPADGHSNFAFITYWTLYIMAGVGYGDVAPVTDQLRAFAGLQFLFSFVINGYFIGAVAGLMAEDNIDEARNDRIVKTLAVLEYFSVPGVLQLEILQFQSHILNNRVEEAHSDIMQMLPKEIQNNILVQSRIPLLKSLAFFYDIHLNSLVRVASNIVVTAVIPEEGILFCGQRNRNMYIINYGFIDVKRHDGTYFHTLKRGDYFGDLALLKSQSKTDPSAHLGTITTHTMVALNYCDLWMVTPEAFGSVIKLIPRFAGKMRALAVLTMTDYIFSEAACQQNGWKKGGQEPERQPKQDNTGGDDHPTAGGGGGGGGNIIVIDSSNGDGEQSPLGKNTGKEGGGDAGLTMGPDLSMDSIPMELQDDPPIVPQEEEEEINALNSVLEKQMDSLVSLSMEALKLGVSSEGESSNGASDVDDALEDEARKEIETMLKEAKSGMSS